MSLSAHGNRGTKRDLNLWKCLIGCAKLILSGDGLFRSLSDELPFSLCSLGQITTSNLNFGFGVIAGTINLKFMFTNLIRQNLLKDLKHKFAVLSLFFSAKHSFFVVLSSTAAADAKRTVK